MAELKIIATILAKKECVDELDSIFQAVIKGTRQEEGNVSYELHKDVKDPLKYVFIEVWKSKEAIDSHNASAHFGEFKKGVDGKIDALEVTILKKVY